MCVKCTVTREAVVVYLVRFTHSAHNGCPEMVEETSKNVAVRTAHPLKAHLVHFTAAHLLWVHLTHAHTHMHNILFIDAGGGFIPSSISPHMQRFQISSNLSKTAGSGDEGLKVCFLLLLSASVNSGEAGESALHSCASGSSISPSSCSTAHTELLKPDRRLALSAMVGTDARPEGATVLPQQRDTAGAPLLCSPTTVHTSVTLSSPAF